jgi:hypothetical protein
MAAKQSNLLCRLKPKVNYRIIGARSLTTENRLQQIKILSVTRRLAPDTGLTRLGGSERL